MMVLFSFKIRREGTLPGFAASLDQGTRTQIRLYLHIRDILTRSLRRLLTGAPEAVKEDPLRTTVRGRQRHLHMLPKNQEICFLFHQH